MVNDKSLAQIESTVFSIFSIQYPDPMAIKILPKIGSKGYGIGKYF